MKNLFFILVLTLGLMSFISNSNEEKLENITCTRTCTYYAGELVGCTPWDCTFDEIVIRAK